MTVSVLENVCLRFKNTSRWISVKNIIFKAHIVKDSEGLLDVYGHKLLVNLGNSAVIIVHEFKNIPAIAFFTLKILAECDILILRFHKLANSTIFIIDTLFAIRSKKSGKRTTPVAS